MLLCSSTERGLELIHTHFKAFKTDSFFCRSCVMFVTGREQESGRWRGVSGDWLRANRRSWRIRLSKHAESTPPSRGRRRARSPPTAFKAAAQASLRKEFQPLKSFHYGLSVVETCPSAPRGRGAGEKRWLVEEVGEEPIWAKGRNVHSHLILSIASTSHLLLKLTVAIVAC